MSRLFNAFLKGREKEGNTVEPRYSGWTTTINLSNCEMRIRNGVCVCAGVSLSWCLPLDTQRPGKHAGEAFGDVAT